MDFARRINAFTLLFLMLGMLVHSVTPHIHHGIGGANSNHAAVAGVHHHHVHADHDKEHSLLLHLLDLHSHDPHGHAFLHWQFTKEHDNRHAVKHIALLEASPCVAGFSLEATSRPFIPFRPHHDDDGRLDAHALRGPPAVV